MYFQLLMLLFYTVDGDFNSEMMEYIEFLRLLLEFC